MHTAQYTSTHAEHCFQPPLFPIHAFSLSVRFVFINDSQCITARASWVAHNASPVLQTCRKQYWEQRAVTGCHNWRSHRHRCSTAALIMCPSHMLKLRMHITSGWQWWSCSGGKQQRMRIDICAMFAHWKGNDDDGDGARLPHSKLLAIILDWLRDGKCIAKLCTVCGSVVMRQK